MSEQQPKISDVQRAIELMDSSQSLLEKAVQEMTQARALLFLVRHEQPATLPLCIRVMSAHNALMDARAQVQAANFRNQDFLI